MAQENQNIDTTYTKIFVGGLSSTTSNEGLRNFFQQFGEITDVNIVYDIVTQQSRGYGFVTFRDSESAMRACMNPNPLIEGRIANCNQANVNAIYSDDLCFLSPSFREYMQLPPLPPSTSVYWNQYYQQYYPPYCNYPQYHLSYYNYPQYHLPYYNYPQYQLQHELGNNIDQTLQAQSTNINFREWSNQN